MPPRYSTRLKNKEANKLKEVEKTPQRRIELRFPNVHPIATIPIQKSKVPKKVYIPIIVETTHAQRVRLRRDEIISELKQIVRKFEWVDPQWGTKKHNFNFRYVGIL